MSRPVDRPWPATSPTVTSETVIRHLKNVEIVPPDLGGRLKDGAHRQRPEIEIAGGQQSLLDLAGELELARQTLLFGNVVEHRLHRGGHVVERPCEITELVPSFDRHPVIEVPALHLPRAVGQSRCRPRDGEDHRGGSGQGQPVAEEEEETEPRQDSPQLLAELVA